MKNYYYKVAGFVFRIVVPDAWEIQKLLPSFLPFVWDGEAEELLFTLYANVQDLQMEGKTWKHMVDSDNDIGHVRLLRYNEEYKIELSYLNPDKLHIMTCDGLFTEANVLLDETDEYLGMALNSMIRVVFAQAVLPHQAISMHSSCVWKDGKAYLFMGKSGTGKSTHSSLWIKNLPDVHLLNDDNPTIRLEGRQVIVYGTPWSGKTPCYRNLQFPAAAMVRLSQAPHNRFIPIQETEAFMAVLPSCSVIQGDEQLQGCLYDTLITLLEYVKVGWLECLPDADAAHLCYNSLNSL